MIVCACSANFPNGLLFKLDGHTQAIVVIEDVLCQGVLVLCVPA
jgi:hypothetical protein